LKHGEPAAEDTEHARVPDVNITKEQVAAIIIMLHLPLIRDVHIQCVLLEMETVVDLNVRDA
jgi:hypothetical protein